MDIKVKVGSLLKEEREKKGLTQETLSQKSGIDRTFISHIETGSRNVSIETLDKILAGLNITFSDFFKQKTFKK